MPELDQDVVFASFGEPPPDQPVEALDPSVVYESYGESPDEHDPVAVFDELQRPATASVMVQPPAPVPVEEVPTIPQAFIKALKTLLQAMGAGGGVFIGMQEFRMAAGAAGISLAWNILTAMEIDPPRWLTRRHKASRRKRA